MVNDPFRFLRADLQEVERRIAVGPLSHVYGCDALREDGFPFSRDLLPALVLTVTRFFHGAREKALSLAVMVQLIFLAARLHVTVTEDGRGKGTAQAILFGDCCYSRFFSLAASSGLGRFIRPLAETVCLMGEGGIERCRKILGGEPVAMETLYKETAGLFGVACRCAADLAGATAEQQRLLHRFGLRLGLGYALRRMKSFGPAATYLGEARADLAYLPGGIAREILEELVDYLDDRPPERAVAALKG